MENRLSRLGLICKKARETGKLEKKLYLRSQENREFKTILDVVKNSDKSSYGLVLDKYKELPKKEDTDNLALKIYKNKCLPQNSFEQSLFDAIYFFFSKPKYKSSYNPL